MLSKQDENNVKTIFKDCPEIEDYGEFITCLMYDYNYDDNDPILEELYEYYKKLLEDRNQYLEDLPTNLNKVVSRVFNKARKINKDENNYIRYIDFTINHGYYGYAPSLTDWLVTIWATKESVPDWAITEVAESIYDLVSEGIVRAHIDNGSDNNFLGYEVYAPHHIEDGAIEFAIELSSEAKEFLGYNEKGTVKEANMKNLEEGYSIIEDPNREEEAWNAEPVFGDLTKSADASYDACVEIEKWLSENGFNYEEVECYNPVNDGFTIVLSGDWKHDHLRLDHEMWDRFHLACIGEDVVSNDGGDYSTKRHSFVNPKKLRADYNSRLLPIDPNCFTPNVPEHHTTLESIKFNPIVAKRNLKEAKDKIYKAKVGNKWLKGKGFTKNMSDADTFESETEPTQRINQMKKDGKIDKGAKITMKSVKENVDFEYDEYGIPKWIDFDINEEDIELFCDSMKANKVSLVNISKVTYDQDEFNQWIENDSGYDGGYQVYLKGMNRVRYFVWNYGDGYVTEVHKKEVVTYIWEE